MAVSDAELIQLLGRAEAGTRGPQGEPGIGIADIQQPDPNGFVITLTNGKTKRIDLVPGRDGEVGPPGVGERGPEGPVGRRGEPGSAGLLAAMAVTEPTDETEPG